MAKRIKVLKTRIFMRRDSFDNWFNNNPILAIGQIGYDATIKKIKIGDGVTRWNNLPYFALETDLDTESVSCYYQSAEEWGEDTSLISQQNVFYVYTDHQTVEKDGELISIPGLKIGDGQSYVVDLPFITDYISESLLNHTNNSTVHITQQEREFWNNKVTCYLDYEDDEHVIFDKN